MSIKITIPVPIYRTKVTVCIGSDRYCNSIVKREIGDIAEVMGCQLTDGLAGLTFPVTNEIGGISYFILIDEKYDKMMATVIHECHHVSYLILSNVGISCVDSTQEAFAYLQNHLIDVIEQKYNIVN